MQDPSQIQGVCTYGYLSFTPTPVLSVKKLKSFRQVSTFNLELPSLYQYKDNSLHTLLQCAYFILHCFSHSEFIRHFPRFKHITNQKSLKPKANSTLQILNKVRSLYYFLSVKHCISILKHTKLRVQIPLFYQTLSFTSRVSLAATMFRSGQSRSY